MGRSRYKIIHADQPHFLTLTVLHWLPLFTKPDTVSILLDSFRFLQLKGFKIYAWVILENHLHLIGHSSDLSQDIANFKSYTSKQLIAYLKSHNVKTLLDQLTYYKKAHKTQSQYQLWQEGCHPELISNADMMLQKITYIHENPVKRGYVDLPEHWRCSSARSYVDQDGLLEVIRCW